MVFAATGLVTIAAQPALATIAAQPALTEPIGETLPLSVSRIGTLAPLGAGSTKIAYEGPLATATVAPVSLSLPAGTYDLNTCLGSVPASASVARPCVTRTVTLEQPGTVMSQPSTLTVYRPLSGASSVAVVGTVNVRLRTAAGSSLFATSLQSLGSASIGVAPLTATAATPQLRGSNVHLFKPGVTLDEIAGDLDVLKAQGATIVRTSMPWSMLQPQKTKTFDPDAAAKVDGFLALARDRGLRVLAVFGSTPCWASSAPATVKGDCTDPNSGWGRYSTSSAAALTAAAREFGTRWGSQLAGVEYWNEPNNSGFFAAGAKAYAGLLKIFYPAVKAAAPQLTVVGGDLSLADTTFLQAMYAAGARGYYDALSVHPYQVMLGSAASTSDPSLAWPAAPAVDTFATGVQAVHAVMVANGDSAVPLWITEFGFSTCTAASKLCVSQDAQAQYLAASFRMAARWTYVPVVLSYLTRDPMTDGSWNGSFGMLDNAYGAKTASDRVTATWNCLEAATC